MVMIVTNFMGAVFSQKRFEKVKKPMEKRKFSLTEMNDQSMQRMTSMQNIDVTSATGPGTMVTIAPTG